MDLSNFNTIEASEKGFTYVVKVPYGENKGDDSDIKIEVLGVFSKAFEDASAAITAYQQKCWSKGKPEDKEHMRTLNIGLVVACTRGWSGLTENGQEVKFSKAEAQRVYEAYPWLLGQVSEALADMESMLAKK